MKRRSTKSNITMSSTRTPRKAWTYPLNHGRKMRGSAAPSTETKRIDSLSLWRQPLVIKLPPKRRKIKSRHPNKSSSQAPATALILCAPICQTTLVNKEKKATDWESINSSLKSTERTLKRSRPSPRAMQWCRCWEKLSARSYSPLWPSRGTSDRKGWSPNQVLQAP